MINPRVSNGHRRRQLRARILREQHECWICDEEVDVTISTPAPLSPEVHEVIPIAHGGDPLDPTNCVLTHRVCNQCAGTGQHRGFCILCLRTAGATADGHAPAGQHCTPCNGVHHPRPGVAFETSRTW